MRGEYNTRQKRDILSFLQQHDLEPYSVDDLVFEMQEQGEKIGRTTVYRHLESLAEHDLHFRPHPYRMRPKAQGVSHSLKVSTDTFTE